VNVFYNPVTAGFERGGRMVVYFILSAYLLGVLYHLVRLLINISRILKLTRAFAVTKEAGLTQVHVPPAVQPFTFFNYMFINGQQRRHPAIAAHEYVHIRQYHSADILYFELIAALCWFNPFVRYYKTTIKELHEFIADEEACRHAPDAASYAMLLVREASTPDRPQALTSQLFNQSNLKNRIIMLSKDPSGRYQRIRYVFGPVLIVSFIAFSAVYCSKSSDRAPGEQLNADVNYDYLETQTVEGKPLTGVRFQPPVVVKDVELENIIVEGKPRSGVRFQPPVVVKDVELEDVIYFEKKANNQNAATIQGATIKTAQQQPEVIQIKFKEAADPADTGK